MYVSAFHLEDWIPDPKAPQCQVSWLPHGRPHV